MSYQVFARKWRPQKFEEMVGQAPVAQTLLNAIQSNRLAHAYLFSGARGVGKTTVARLLAKAVNCENGPTVHPCGQCTFCREIAGGNSVDVLEIDGASNRGIDNIRELKDQIKYAPLKGKYKVYIIDEVHMLTTEAFNALLKTLEEPPPSTIFVLATTELHKIPSTILSRCQQFQFKKISRLEIISQIRRIIEEEKIQISEKALLAVAKAANGSMRDALSILDQVVSYSGSNASDDDVRSILGVADTRTLYDLTEAVSRKEIPAVLELFRSLMDAGYDLKIFCQEWISHLRNLMMMQLMPDPKTFLDLPAEEIADLSKLTHLFTLDQLQRFFRIFTQVEEDIRISSQPALVMEVALMKTASLQPLEPIQSLIERLDRLADKVGKNPADSIPLPSVPKSDPNPRMTSIPPSGEPAPVPVMDNGISKNVEETWSRLMHQLKDKKPNLESYLKQSLWVTEGKEGIQVGFPEGSPFISLLKKEENLKSLTAECREIFKKNIIVEIIPVKSEDPKDIPGRSVVPGKLDSLSFIQKVQETLGAKIVEVKELT